MDESISRGVRFDARSRPGLLAPRDLGVSVGGFDASAPVVSRRFSSIRRATPSTIRSRFSFFQVAKDLRLVSFTPASNRMLRSFALNFLTMFLGLTAHQLRHVVAGKISSEFNNLYNKSVRGAKPAAV